MLSSFDKILRVLGLIFIGLFILNLVTGGVIATAFRDVITTIAADSSDSTLTKSFASSSVYDKSPTIITVDNFSDQPVITQFGLLTLLLGCAIFVISHLCVVLQAIFVSVPWGLACFIFFPASFIYALLNFDQCRVALCGLIVGVILSVIGWCLLIL